MSEHTEPQDALHRPWVKICGATRPADIDLLAGAGVDWQYQIAQAQGRKGDLAEGPDVQHPSAAIQRRQGR